MNTFTPKQKAVSCVLKIVVIFSADSYKVNFLCAVLTDIDIVPSALHFKIHHILKHCRKHLSVKAPDYI